MGGAHGHTEFYSSIPLWLDFWAAFRVSTVTNAAAMDSLPLSPRDMDLGVEQLCCIACIVQFAEMAFHENFNLHFLDFFLSDVESCVPCFFCTLISVIVGGPFSSSANFSI